jgi:molybdenum cofactor cytidylyltransferase
VTTAAVVLAAGAGSRFAGTTHKLAADVQGRPLVSHALTAAVASGLDVLVVVGAVDFDVPDGVVIVDNPRWADGLATSLQAGIAAAAGRGHDAVVVAHGDQPGIPAAAWQRVAAGSGRSISIAVYDGRRGHPVRLEASVWPLLPVDGDEGAAALLRERPDLVGEVACDGDPADVDTVEDLARWS